MGTNLCVKDTAFRGHFGHVEIILQEFYGFWSTTILPLQPPKGTFFLIVSYFLREQNPNEIHS